jgi:hypothetical protein
MRSSVSFSIEVCLALALLAQQRAPTGPTPQPGVRNDGPYPGSPAATSRGGANSPQYDGNGMRIPAATLITSERIAVLKEAAPEFKRMFREQTTEIYALTRQISEAATEKKARDKSRDVEKKIEGLIGKLFGTKPARPKSIQPVDWKEGIAELQKPLNALRPKITDFDSKLPNILDAVELNSIIEGLVSALDAARRLAKG